MAVSTSVNGAPSAAEVKAAAEAAEVKAAAEAAEVKAAAEAAALAEAIEIAKLATAAPTPRVPTYRVPDGARRVSWGDYELSIGTNVKSGDAYYVSSKGSAQTGFPQGAIAALIAADVVPRATIRALWAAADAS